MNDVSVQTEQIINAVDGMETPEMDEGTCVVPSLVRPRSSRKAHATPDLSESESESETFGKNGIPPPDASPADAKAKRIKDNPFLIVCFPIAPDKYTCAM